MVNVDVVEDQNPNDNPNSQIQNLAGEQIGGGKRKKDLIEKLGALDSDMELE